MYIESMHLNKEYQEGGDQNSDVGTLALHRLLHDPYVQRRNISSCIYILDPTDYYKSQQEKDEDESSNRHRNDSFIETEESLRIKEEKKQRIDQYARLDANPYLRNGFYQDCAVAQLPKNAARILLATPSQWNQPLKTHEDVATIQLQVSTPIPTAVGKDSEIKQLTKIMCEDCSYMGMMTHSVTSSNPSDVLGDTFKQAMMEIIMSTRDETRASSYKKAVELQIQQGGSLVRSNALHLACGMNDVSIVKCILQLDPSTLNSRDDMNVTPFMVAATYAAGKNNMSGFQLKQPVIDILLAAGADKNARNNEGLTAYGMFLDACKEYNRMMNAMCGQRTPSNNNFVPGYAELEAKLKPLDGPTRVDLMGVDIEKPGIIYYGDEKEVKKKRAKRG